MKETEIVALVLLGLVFLSCLLSIIFSIIENAQFDKQFKSHQEFKALIDKYYELKEKYIIYRKEHVLPLIDEIDFFEANKRYYSPLRLKREKQRNKTRLLSLEKHNSNLDIITQQQDAVLEEQQAYLSQHSQFKKWLIKNKMWK